MTPRKGALRALWTYTTSGDTNDARHHRKREGGTGENGARWIVGGGLTFLRQKSSKDEGPEGVLIEHAGAADGKDYRS